ncbi:MAG: glycosyltransferase [Candidatus Kuenenia sp.]|nr:glycosyltransferase [Candidatus Kuenenia hertensis]
MPNNIRPKVKTVKAKSALVLFVKYPKKGRVKTRLALETDDDFATEIYACFIKDSLSRFQNIKGDLIPFISEKNKISLFQKKFDFTKKCYDQSSGHLGIRMKHAMKVMFNDKYDHVVIIGSDCPDLPVSYINNAFSRLLKNDVVIGPATDGGYYLIGSSNPKTLNILFTNIDWSTDKVLLQTIDRINSEGFSYYLLNEWCDIDALENLKFCYKNAGKRKFSHSHTIHYLKNNQKFKSYK